MICKLNVNSIVLTTTVNSIVLTTTAELDRKPIYHRNKQIPCRPAWWNFITYALIDGLENLEHMKIAKCQPLIPESGMNWGCLTSLALHPGPSRLPPSSVLHSVWAHHFSDSNAPPLPGAQYVVCQARGGWNPSIHISYIHQVQPCFSTLPELTSSRPPLGIPPRTTLGGDSWHRPQIPMNIHPLLSGQVLFPLPRPLPLKLLSQRQVLWASQHLTTKVSQW